MGKLGNLYVFKELVFTDFKLKYKSPIFGYTWSIINPLIILLTLYIVFSFIMNISYPNYQLFLLIGIIIWNFFKDATDMALNSLQDKEHLIKKLNISPLTYVISAVLTSFLNLLINLIIFVLMVFLLKVNINFYSVLYSIFYLLILVISTFSISLIITGIYLKFRDIKQTWSVITHIWFWLTPIFYSEQQIPLNIRKFYMVNPLARLINHFRDIFLFDFISPPEQTMITIILCFAIFLVGILIYRNQHIKFSEEL